MSRNNLPRVSARDLEFNLRDMDPDRDKVPVPRIGNSRRDDELVEDLSRELIHVLQDLVEKSDTYIYTYNVLALDNFDNAMFEEVLELAFYLAMIVRDNNRRIDERRLVRDVGSTVIPIITGYYYDTSAHFRDDLDASDKTHSNLMKFADSYYKAMDEIDDYLDGDSRDRDRGRDSRSSRRDRDRGRSSRRDSRGRDDVHRFGRRDRNERNADDSREIGRGLTRGNSDRRSSRTTSENDTGVRFTRDTTKPSEDPNLNNRTNRDDDRRSDRRDDRRASREAIDVHEELAVPDVRPPRTESKLGVFQGQAIIEIIENDGFIVEDGTHYVPYDGVKYGLGFKRSSDRMYLPAWNRNTEMAFYVFKPDGEKDVQIFNRSENQLDREAHKTTAVAEYERSRAEELKRQLEREVIEVERETVSVNFTPSAPDFKSVVLKGIRPAAALRIAMADNDVQASRNFEEDGKGRKTSLLTTRHALYTTLGGFSAKTLRMVDELRSAESNIMAQSIMETFKVNHEYDPVLLEELGRVSALFLGTLNEIIRGEMGATFSATDFITDFRPAIEKLNKDFGSSFGNGLRDHPGLIVRSIGLNDDRLLEQVISHITDAEELPAVRALRDVGISFESLVEGLMEGKDGVPAETPTLLEIFSAASDALFNNGVLMIVRPIVITTLNVGSKDFGINVGDLPMGLKTTHQPLLANAVNRVDAVVFAGKNPETSIGAKARLTTNRYVQTRDGAVYRLFSATINPGFTLVQREL